MRKSRNSNRLHRKARIRAKVSGTSSRPRVCVFRSLRSMYVQIIDDVNGKTLLGIDFKKILPKKEFSVKSVDEFAKEISKQAKNLKIEEVVFDRGGYRFHGKVKALAEGLRKGGLKF